MRIKYLAYAFEIILRNFGFILLSPCIFSVYYKEYDSAIPFIVSAFICFFLSYIFSTVIRKDSIDTLNDIKK